MGTCSPTSFVNALESLASIAYQFGPFFFAVLFMLVITRSARNWYEKARQTAQGAAPQDDLVRTYRTNFRISSYFGIVVALSVAWWMFAAWTKHHPVEGVIVALTDSESLEAVASGSEDSAFFWRMVPRSGNVAHLKDYSFVAILDHPPHVGDKVSFYYWQQLAPSGTGVVPSPTATIDIPLLLRLLSPTFRTRAPHEL